MAICNASHNSSHTVLKMLKFCQSNFRCDKENGITVINMIGHKNVGQAALCILGKICSDCYAPTLKLKMINFTNFLDMPIEYELTVKDNTKVSNRRYTLNVSVSYFYVQLITTDADVISYNGQKYARKQSGAYKSCKRTLLILLV